jgi:hypothetical protein
MSTVKNTYKFFTHPTKGGYGLEILPPDDKIRTSALTDFLLIAR